MGIYGPWTRQRVLITLAALAVIPWWKGGGGFLASMPTVANAGMNQIVVGASPADQARYELRSPAEFEATVVDYQFNSFGMSGGFLKDMGARAMLAFASTDSYQSAVARSKRSGACLGSCLGNSTMTLILIPRDAEALSQMSVSRRMGSRFHIAGQYLVLQSVKRNGQLARVDFGNTGILLVSAMREAN